MNIEIKNNRRILVNEDKEELDISDGTIIEYTGIYYKSKSISKNENKNENINIQNIYVMDEIECKFVGKIETSRANASGITGIYIIPLYLFDSSNCEWVRISNYREPKNKYFLYPHLLMLPEKYYHYKPLYFLHTCKQTDFFKQSNIIKTINLDYFD